MTKQLMLESMRSWGLGLANVSTERPNVSIERPEQGS
jgi:hypothetical protein